MNMPAVWTLVTLGLTVVVVRRRSLAVISVTCQALVLAVLAISRARSGNEIVVAAALGVRAVALAVLLLALVSRSREARPVRTGVSPWMRGGLALGLALGLIWLAPISTGATHGTYEGALALVAFGLATAATRRATLFQVMSIVLVENGLALAALTLGGGSSLVIELGVTLDLTLVAVVAGVFHERIFAEFGAGDSSALASLRD